MASDPEREQALEAYKKTLLDSREWEAKLKALRLDIKGLQHDFDVSEDNIKALQSVGQIIGEVLKQLDEERCELHRNEGTNGLLDLMLTSASHCKGVIGTVICGRLPLKGRQGEAEAGHKSGARHDHPHNHAHAAARG